MDYASLISAVIQVAGPLIGQQMSQMDQQEALRLLRESRDATGRIQVPILERLVAERVPDTALGGIKEDPRYRAQQAAADAQLDNVIGAGGLTLADKAALNEVRNRVSRTESAGRRAIEQDMSRRGTLDSGAQLAMSLSNQQNAAQSAAEAGERTAADAQMRAYNAILARSRMATEGLDRDWRQKAEAARAQDAINKGNTDIQNLTNKYNAGLPQQGFENELAKARAMNPATAGLAGYYQGQATKTQDQWAQGSKAVGQGVAAAYGPGEYSDEEKELIRKHRDDKKRQNGGWYP